MRRQRRIGTGPGWVLSIAALERLAPHRNEDR